MVFCLQVGVRASGGRCTMRKNAFSLNRGAPLVEQRIETSKWFTRFPRKTSGQGFTFAVDASKATRDVCQNCHCVLKIRAKTESPIADLRPMQHCGPSYLIWSN